jgi:ATP/maltotriose-dependent transcriptional regulator MalT
MTLTTIDSFSERFIPRLRLSALLTQCSNYPLTIIAAPAGFGKPTLVTAWRKSAMSATPVVWLSLNADDHEATQLLSRIGRSFISLVGNTQKFESLFLSDPAVEPQAIVAALIQITGLFTEPHILIIDDFHFCTDPAIQQSFTNFIEHMSPELHVIVISRTMPTMPLARWRANGRLAEIGSNLLRFTREEIQALLGGVGIHLDPTDVLQLERRTEGWIAGLQLLALAAQNRSQAEQLTLIHRLSGENHSIFDYLIEEIVDRQSAENRSFLIQTAIIEQMNGSLCNAITMWLDGEQQLAQLDEVRPLLESQHANDVMLHGIHHVIRATIMLQQNAAQSLEWYQRAEQLLPQTSANWQGALALGRGFAYLEIADLLRAEHSFAAAIAPSRSCGNLYGAMYAIYNLGRTQIAQGALQRAQSTFEYALNLAGREPEPMQQLVSWAYLGLAEVAYEHNNLATATQQVLKAIALGKRRENWETIARSYLVMNALLASMQCTRHCMQYT